MKNKPTLLWLTKDKNPNLPSVRLRVLNLGYLIGKKYNQETIPAPVNIIQLLKTLPKLIKSDVVILQKQLVSPFALLVIRSFAKKFYFDFDDAVHIRREKDGSYKKSRKCLWRFKLICRTADAVISGNIILKKIADKCGAKITLTLPTALRLPSISVAHKKNDDETIELGWIGTSANLVYLENIEPVFIKLKNNGLKFKLSVMCDKPPKFESFNNLNYEEWSEKSEQAFLSKIDIGLMPLTDDEHTRGKCAFKALQYMSFGKAVVVSNVGINAQWTQGAGYAVNNDEEMFNALEILIKSSTQRETMGCSGRKTIEKYFTEDIISMRLLQILDTPELVKQDFPPSHAQNAF